MYSVELIVLFLISGMQDCKPSAHPLSNKSGLSVSVCILSFFMHCTCFVFCPFPREMAVLTEDRRYYAIFLLKVMWVDFIRYSTPVYSVPNYFKCLLVVLE